jgi:uncharacterized protein YgbK (DUF1537 family)
MTNTTKIIVLDDDPTGSQTVHGCLLLTRWDVETLKTALSDAAPLFFVLTNTRGMNAARAAEVTREVCHNLKIALETMTINPVLVSRSDSTLRGHYPVETDVIAEELGPFDAHFLVPAFFEGGRITRDSIHYLKVNGVDVPVHETEFARDSVFGYSHSFLPDYVAEKTQGRISAHSVERFLLADIRSGGSSCASLHPLHLGILPGVLDRLLALQDNQCGVVDAENYDDLERFTADVRAAAAQEKRFLFRSAASLVKALANLPPQPVSAEAMGRFTRGARPGAVIVGSHVEKSSRQLARLLQEPGVVGIEVDVQKVPEQPAVAPGILPPATLVHPCTSQVLKAVLQQIEVAFAAGKTSVVYTSRGEVQFADQAARLAFGEAVSALLMDVIRNLPQDLGFLIGKGGITSNDMLSSGLALRAARVLGQVAPGVSVVRCPADHPRFPELPVVIFPGNVGDDDALALVYRRFSQH